jgi:CubicO group peptidase (beta-lactamase class C family)
MDSVLLARAIDFIREKNLRVHSLLVIRNGYIVAEAYFYPFARGSKHDLASVTKSFTSTLVGIAVDKGYIKSVQQPVLDFFPGRTIANVDANKRAMTLEHLLTMTSGLQCINEPSEVTLSQMMASPDWVQFMLDLPMSDEPGTRFVYNSGGSHLLSAIIRETTGMSASAFAQKHLFEPLGISDVVWPFDPQGVNNHGWGSLKLTPRDMAKLGYLYLNEGCWDGKQVVSPEWVAAATREHVFLHGTLQDGYGYQWWCWWVSPRGHGYSAVGRGGQRIFVLPYKDMVVAVTAGTGDRDQAKLDEQLPSFIIPAAKSTIPLPPNPKGVALLESTVRQAALCQTQAKPVPPLPEMARKVSGHTYALDANPYGLVALSLTFPRQEEAVFGVSVVEDNRTLEFPVGLDNLFRISPGRFGLPAAAKGFWETDNVFVLELDEIGNINHWRAQMAFEGEEVTVMMKEMTGLPAAKFGGKARK